MKASLVKAMSKFTERSGAKQLNAGPRAAGRGCELTRAELDAVHGGELKIEMPAYIPLSQSHPKTEVVLPRVPYK